MKYSILLAATALCSLVQAAPLHINVPDLIDGNGRSVLNTAAGDQSFGASANSAFVVAEDFTVGDGGWRVASIDFFGYQTGAAGFTFTTATWSVVSGALNVGTVVASGTTAVLDGGTVGHRVLDTDLGATNRAIKRIHTDMADFDLAEGNYWLTWSLAGTSSSGPFVPPSVNAAGNAQQRPSSGTTFNPFVMTGSNRAVALPFTINGSTAATVAEPSSAALVLLAGAGLRAGQRRQRRQVQAVA